MPFRVLHTETHRHGLKTRRWIIVQALNQKHDVKPLTCMFVPALEKRNDPLSHSTVEVALTLQVDDITILALSRRKDAER